MKRLKIFSQLISLILIIILLIFMVVIVLFNYKMDQEFRDLLLIMIGLYVLVQNK